MSRPYLNEVLQSGIVATLTTPSYKLVENSTFHKVIIKATGAGNGTVVIKGRTENGIEHDLHYQSITTATTIVADYDRPLYEIGAVVPTYSGGNITVEYEGCK